MDASPIRAVGLDYDRTLTDMDLVLRPATLDALREARAEGLHAVVVSGRDAAFLSAALGDAVDLVVAENGAFLVDPDGGRPEPLFDDWPGVEALGSLGIALDHAVASASAPAEHAEALERALAAAGLRVRLERNLDRVMLLPPNVEKALGFLAALERLGVAPSEAAAIGDGENDLSLLRAAGHRVAVANAVPEVKAVAHRVMSREGGEGVQEWLREVWRPAAARPRAGAPRG